MKRNLPLEADEIVETRSPGALNLSQSGRWRLGEWICTNERLLFLQGGDVVFWVALGDLLLVERCEREYSFGKKPCLKNTYQEKDGEPFDKFRTQRTFWLVTPDIEQWRIKLFERLVGRTSEADVAALAKELDGGAEELVWFLHRKRCATISELATKINADNHMDVLQMIRREINPASERLTGRPAFVFRQYEWWFTDDVTAGEPFSDVIDEGDFCRVIVEAPEDAKAKIEGNLLELNTDNGFKCKIRLPKDAVAFTMDGTHRNGIMEFMFRKKNIAG